MLWLFELSVLCALSALLLSPLFKMLGTPSKSGTSRARLDPRTTGVLRQALVAIPIPVASDAPGARA